MSVRSFGVVLLCLFSVVNSKFPSGTIQKKYDMKQYQKDDTEFCNLHLAPPQFDASSVSSSDAYLPSLFYDRTVSFLQNEFTPSQWKDTDVERNEKVGGTTNSKIPSIFDHMVRNSSIIESYYQYPHKRSLS